MRDGLADPALRRDSRVGHGEQMKAKRIIVSVSLVLIITGVILGVVLHRRAGITKVATGKVLRQDILSVVSGTGQIKPKTYVNVGATAFGRITKLNVKEGDHVHRGALLATIENVQPAATVAAQQATIASSRTDVNSFSAAEKTAAANVTQAQADLEQKRLDFERAKALYDSKLIAKQDFDGKKAAFDMSAATLDQRLAVQTQSAAQTDSQRARVNQAVASQRSNYDALDKTVSRAPFDGLVTNVPVREGETVVVGIQNAQGSTLMTLADMSVITAEVKVDETDIVNVVMNQPVDVTVDALPGRSFKGHVTEVGDQALLRTTGIATSQSTTGTEEAKDFKVVVTLDQVSDELRPGLSATARITTAHKINVLTIPIQALVQRDPSLEAALASRGGAAPTNPPAVSKGKLVQGGYKLKMDGRTLHTVFVPLITGVTGATEIEVLSGLKEGDEIVTGRYKVLRALKSGTTVKIDNSPESVSASN